MRASSSGSYRPDIDGLRAVAISLVLLFHALPTIVPGGFIGVDVFFVISGYLITGIIRNHVTEEDFSYVAFYVRRIIRLVPALCLVLAGTLIAGRFLLFSDEFASLGRHAASGALFLSNIVLWREAGYFDAGADQKPLLHLWSLGVEEQFYLLWPTLLLLVLKRNRPLPIVFLVLSCSLLACVVTTNRHPVAAFYLLPSRFWELLVGAMLSLVEASALGSSLAAGLSQKRIRRLLADTMPLLAISALLGMAFMLDKGVPYPGSAALLPTGCAALLIASRTSRLNTFVLSARPMVFLGLISYPLYLWHWPLVYVFRRLNDDVLSPSMGATAIALAVVAAVLTYVGIERPLRRVPRTTRPRVALFLLAVTAAVITLGQLVSRGYLVPELAAKEKTIVQALGDWASPAGGLDGSQLIINTIRGNTGRTAMFIGDSHLEQYWPRLERRVTADPDHTLDVAIAAWGGCPPLPDTKEIAGNPCGAFIRQAFEAAAKSDVEVVVLGAYWERYFLGVLGRNDVAKTTLMSTTAGSQKPLVLGEQGANEAFDRLEGEIRILIGAGKKVIILLSNPAGRSNNPREMLRELRETGNVSPNKYAIVRSSFVSFAAPVMDRLRAIAARTGAGIVDPVEFLCDDRICPAMSDGRPIYRDDDHMRPYFVKDHVRFLDPLISAASAKLD